MLPFASIESVPLAGVALPVSTDQFPPVAVTEYVAPAMTADTVASASAVPLTVGVESFDNAEDVIATDGAVVSITIVFVLAFGIHFSAILLPAAKNVILALEKSYFSKL